MTAIDIGPGESWAERRGVDEYYVRLARYMGNLHLSAFLMAARQLEEAAASDAQRTRFAEELEILKTLPSPVTRQILTHPAWVYWVRATRKAIEAQREGRELDSYYRGHLDLPQVTPASYLPEILSQFSQLVLAGCVLAGRELEISLHASGPYLSLAGTGFSYALPESAQAGGQVMCRLRKTSAQSFCLSVQPEGTSEAAQIDYTLQGLTPVPESGLHHWLPRIERDGSAIEIDNHDPRIVNNWVSADIYLKQAAVRIADDRDIPAWEPHLREALDLLQATCAPLDQEIFYIIRSIVPVVAARPDQNISVSSRDYFGAIQCSNHPYLLQSDVLAHEYRHNLLNAILEAQPVLDASNPTEAFLYSPWRMDRRPLIGVLHGIYAFTEVVGVHVSYLEKGRPTAEMAALAEKQILTNVFRLQIAQEELAKHARLTPFGSGLVEGLGRRIQRYADVADQLDKTRAEEARAAVRRHRAAWIEANKEPA